MPDARFTPLRVDADVGSDGRGSVGDDTPLPLVEAASDHHQVYSDCIKLPFQIFEVLEVKFRKVSN